MQPDSFRLFEDDVDIDPPECSHESDDVSAGSLLHAALSKRIATEVGDVFYAPTTRFSDIEGCVVRVQQKLESLQTPADSFLMDLRLQESEKRYDTMNLRLTRELSSLQKSHALVVEERDSVVAEVQSLRSNLSLTERQLADERRQIDSLKDEIRRLKVIHEAKLSELQNALAEKDLKLKSLLAVHRGCPGCSPGAEEQMDTGMQYREEAGEPIVQESEACESVDLSELEGDPEYQKLLADIHAHSLEKKHRKERESQRRRELERTLGLRGAPDPSSLPARPATERVRRIRKTEIVTRGSRTPTNVKRRFQRNSDLDDHFSLIVELDAQTLGEGSIPERTSID